MSQDYSIKLSKSFNKYLTIAKTFFPESGDTLKCGLAWISSILNLKENLILSFNYFCLLYQVNAVFCNRYNILDFKQKLAAKGISHNIQFMKNRNNPIGSS